MFVNKKPSQFATGVAIDPVNDVIPRSNYVSPGVYGDAQTSVQDLQAEIAPLTTKGDLLSFDTAIDRFPIGAAVNNSLLQLDSTTAFGFKWGNKINQDLLDTSSPTFLGLTVTDVNTTNQTINIGDPGVFGNPFDINMHGEIMLRGKTYFIETTDLGNPAFNLLSETDMDMGMGWGVEPALDGGNGISFVFSARFSPVFTGAKYIINPFGGNVSVGLTDTITPDPIADAQLHVHGNGFYDDDSYPQLRLRGETDHNKQLVLGYEIDNNLAQIQSYNDESIADPAPLMINQEGGNVFVGFGLPTVYDSKLQVANSILIADDSIPAKQLIVAYDSINNVSYVQSIYQGVSVRPLMIQPSGGQVGFGYPDTHIFTVDFEVAGPAIFASGVVAQSGIDITQAGGGLQFINTGSMTTDSGISFFQGNEEYRIGFDNNGGALGWIRQNVDTADSSHGFVWSAGSVSGPLNAFMYLRGDGKLALSASADAAAFQSLANIYGDMFLSTQSTPANPTGGMKVYPKSDGKLYALNAAGTEYDLTNSGAGSVTSVFTRTGAIVGVDTDYLGVVAFKAFSFQATGIVNAGNILSSGFDETNNNGIIQATGFAGHTELKLNSSGGNVSVGLLPATVAQAKVDIVGAVSLGYVAAPSTPRASTGIVYPKTDGFLYFKNDAGIEYPITTSRQRVSTTVDTNGPQDTFVALDSTPGANLFVIDVANLKNPLVVMWTVGASNPQFQAASGQTIDGLSTAYTMTTLGTNITIAPDPASATKMFITALRGTVI